MDIKKFKDIETKFKDLRVKAERGEIDNNTVNKELKKLMLMDSKGYYWIIGGNSGKWYKYDGKDWKESDPYLEGNKEGELNKLRNNQPSQKDEKLQTENKLIEQKEVDTQKMIPEGNNKVICYSCKGQINSFEKYCHICGANQKKDKKADKSAEIIPELLINSINIISLMFFLGGIGIIIGVITGAVIGVFKDIPVYLQLPQMLADLRSNISGGIVFAILGGIIGFIVFSIQALFLGAFYNMISYFFGGIRFNTKK